jgi:flagellar hook-associated protein 2
MAANLQPTINFGGIASGLDTNAIVDQLMAIERKPETRLKTQQLQIAQKKGDLGLIRDSLKNLQFAAQDLKSPTLWLDTQSVDVNDPTKVAATRTGGAGTGGYQVSVTQLASASQHWFSYPTTAPATDSTITIGGHSITISAGSDVTAAANTINSDSGSPVYASVVTASSGTKYLALSSKTTGTTSDFTVTDPGGLLTEDATKAVVGVNAQGTVGSQSFNEASNVIADAIPGVSLTLKGVTGSSPVTVTVGSPAPDYTAITAKMKAFVDQYNSTVELVRGKLEEAPVVKPQTAGDQLRGDLYGNTMLEGVLSQMRQSVYSTFSTGDTSHDEMSEIGVSTGSAVGGGTLNQDAISGKLSFDTTKFTQALQSNPQSVRKLLGGDTSVSGFAQAFDNLLGPVVNASGSLDQTISSADDQSRQLANQIADMETLMTQKQAMLKQMFTNMETAIQKSQAASAQVSGQLTTLRGGA